MCKCTIGLFQEDGLHFGFDTLTQDVYAKIVCNVDDAFDQASLAWEDRGLIQKTFVQLDGIDGDLAKQVD